MLIIKKGIDGPWACLLLGSSEARSPVGFFWGHFVAWAIHDWKRAQVRLCISRGLHCTDQSSRII